MTVDFRIRTWIALSSLSVALGLTIGCTGEKTTLLEIKTSAPQTDTGAPKTDTGAPNAARPLEDLKKDLKPPVIIKPGQSPDAGTATTKP